MNFEAPHEIGELQRSLAKLLAHRYDLEQRRAIAAAPEGFSRELWTQMGAMGLPALALPSEHGGFGLEPLDLLPILEELGRALVLEPCVSSSMLAAAALQKAAPQSVLAEMLPEVASANMILALAHGEAGARHAFGFVKTTARQSGVEWKLTGTKREVLHGAAADFLLVSAQAEGELALFRVSRNADGLKLRAYRLLDDTPAAEVRLDDTPALLLARGAQALDALACARAWGIAALSGEAVGISAAALKLCVDYLNLRQQFGKPLSANQALRHRVAEMSVMLETLRSAAMMALAACSSSDAGAQADISRAKMLVGRHGVALTELAVQLHGGIGMTTEYAVGNYLRRMTVIDLLLGDAAHHAAARGAAMLVP